MAGPLDGIRVVEIGFWVAGPAAAGIMADWGADVVKIEPPAGDPMRGIFLSAVGSEVPSIRPSSSTTAASAAIASTSQAEEGREIARTLVERADVFVTNLRPGRARALGFDYEALSRANPAPGLLRASPDTASSGPIATGPPTTWVRSGRARASPRCSPARAHEPPAQRGGMGDHTTAIAAASARLRRAGRARADRARGSSS